MSPPASNDPGRDALLSWLKGRVNLDLSQTPDLLWHYTDVGGLTGIVEHEQLWATQTSFLNDSTELAYGIDLATTVIGSYDVTNLKEVTARLVTDLIDPRTAALATWPDRNLDVYVTCFCADGDLLSQWRAYAGRDDAGGYALGMGTRPPLQGWPQTAPGCHDFTLRRVLYDPAEQRATCQDLIDALILILDEDPTDNELQESFASSLIDGVVELASWCKHPAFEEEHEWRIVYVRNNDTAKLDVHHRMSRGLLVPYVKLELPSPIGSLSGHLPLRAINLGPGPEPLLKMRGVQSLLSHYSHYGQVGLEGSDVPLRL